MSVSSAFGKRASCFGALIPTVGSLVNFPSDLRNLKKLLREDKILARLFGLSPFLLCKPKKFLTRLLLTFEMVKILFSLRKTSNLFKSFL